MTFFYNLNQKLAGLAAAPETKQLNERDEGKPGKNFAKISADAAKRYGSKEAGDRVAGAVRAKLAKQGKLEEAELDEGILDNIKSATKKLTGGVNKAIGHGTDADMMMDLQRKMGVPQTGQVPQQQQQGQQQAKEGVDQEAFAALAEPKDKITFADKIAGAKKEVDEMLGDVAAEAIKGALTGGQKKLDKNKNGKIDSGDLAALRAGKTSKGGTVTKTAGGIKHKAAPGVYGGSEEEVHPLDRMKGPSMKRKVADEGFPTVAGARDEMRKRKVGDVTHGAKHDVEEIPGGRRVTRRVDDKGYSVGSDTDDEGNAKSTEKRGRGRPKGKDKGPERVTAKATKHKGGRKIADEGVGEGSDLVKLAKVIQSCQTREQLETARKMAQNFLRKHSSGNDGVAFAGIGKDIKRRNDVVSDIERKNTELKGGQELDEKAVSKKQQKFMGMVHATQKGEKAPSKEVAKVAKTMKKSDAEDFASTKHKGLPEKKKPETKKKEKTEESGTTSGSVATSSGGKGTGGMTFGKGIYDSINREVEDMISESMNVNVSMNVDEHGEPHKSITVSAEGEAAEQLAQLLNLAGMSAQSSDEGCGCGTTPCSCNELDENQPDWPTNTETNDDALQYAGGLNGPKSTGQTVGAPFNRQDQRQGVMGESADIGMKLYAELKSFKG